MMGEDIEAQRLVCMCVWWVDVDWQSWQLTHSWALNRDPLSHGDP